MFCSNCGSKLPEGARFCSTCGTRVADVFEVPAVESKPADTGFVAKTQTVKADEPYEAPLKKRVTFDWSNVIDEPQKKVVPDIKSPWATTGSLDRKELYEEMKPSGERSRTMSFIDVLKAEKEEIAQSSPQAEKPAERPIEYTEVLDPGYLAGEAAPAKEPEQAPVLHFAPLYDDVDEPVVTPFDIPEEEKEPEAPAAVETPAPFVSEIGIEAPAEEPAPEEAAAEEPVQEETVTFVPSPEVAPAEELAAEPVESENRLGGWFDLPDFLKPKEVKPEETVSVSAEEFNIPEVVEEPVFEEPEYEEAEAEESEVVFEEPAAEPEAVFEEPAPAPEVVIEEPAPAPEIEIPEPEAEEEVIFEADFSGSAEDEYLDIDTGRIPDFSRATASFTMPETEEEAEEEPEAEAQEAEADEPLAEEELFEEMKESAPVHTGMTIAAPADKESEIEALKKRLAELMGTSWEEPAPAPVAEEEPEAVEEPEVVAEEPEIVIPEPEAAEAPVFNIEDAYLDLDDFALTPEVSEPAHEMPEIVVAEPEADFEEAEVEIPEAELIDEEEGVISEAELIDEDLIIPEPEFDSYEPETVIPEPEVVAEEPEIVIPEPEVVAEEPEIVIPEPEVVAEEPEEEPVKTIDDFLAAILEEGAAEAPVGSPAEVVIPEPEVVIEEPEIVIPEPEVVAEEPEIVIPEPEVAVEEPEVVIPEPEKAAEPEEVLGAVLTDEELGISIPEFAEAAPAEAEAAVEETAPEEKETDALSLEDLEKDLFGVSSSPQAEVEATKKIDKFYTLYRKNEEFQRLLDEEYNKLKAAGGPAPEPAIPEPEEPVPAKKIEDATIYQDFDLEKEAAKLREQQAEAEAEDAEKAAAMSAAEVSGAVSAAAPAAAAAAAGAAILTADKDDLEIEEVEKGGGCLTVLAVVIAILLIILLGVILVLNFMPDSAIAFKIDSIIENITSHFTAVDVMGKQFLL